VDALVLSDSGGFRLIGTQSWAHWLEWWTLKWTQNSDFSALRSSQTALPERHNEAEEDGTRERAKDNAGGVRVEREVRARMEQSEINL